MSDVRTILSPLFPGEVFADADQAFVERQTLPVGPSGGQVRSAVEEIWPDQTFADDDVLVVENSRKAMTDTVILPGEDTSDTFDGAVGAVNSLIWQPSSKVALDGLGRASFPNDGASAGVGASVLQLLSQVMFSGKTASVEWASIAAPANGYITTSLNVKSAADPTHYYLSVSESGGTLTFSVNAWSITKQSLAYNATAHRHWRIRSADQVYFETSPDGATWTTGWAIAPPSWLSTGCVYSLTAGPWHVTTVPAPTLAEGFSLA